MRIPLLHGEQADLGFSLWQRSLLDRRERHSGSSFALLEGLEVLAISALRHTPHPSHSTVEQSLEWARRIGARQTWFTHIAHELGHEETNRTLPANVRLAYDGLSVPVTL